VRQPTREAGPTPSAAIHTAPLAVGGERLSLYDALRSGWSKHQVLQALEAALASAREYIERPPGESPMPTKNPGSPAPKKRRLLPPKDAAILGVPRTASLSQQQAGARIKLDAAKARKQHEKRRIKSGRTPTDY
jgi:hypothetical protein